jgi:exopolysaccharide production protein ExoZ
MSEASAPVRIAQRVRGGLGVITNIQVLRALAAYMVVFYHLQPMLTEVPEAPFDTTFGASGVDIFFVISGFIMFHTTQAGDRSTGTFWMDRIRRIVPLYWVATLLLLGIFLFGRNPNGLAAVDAGDIATSLFFIPDVRADGEHGPVLSLGWTLIYEMFFYFLFGLTFFLRSQAKALAALVVSFCGFAALGLLVPGLPYAVLYYTNPIMLEFAAGCALALAYRQPRFGQGRAAAPIGYALLLAGAAGIVATELLPKHFETIRFLRPFVFGVPSLAIVLGALLLDKAGHRIGGRFLVLQGAASYAVYLFHPVVMQAVTKLLKTVFDMPPVDEFLADLPDGIEYLVTAGILIGCAMVAAGVVATIIHLWVELPLHAWLKTVGSKRKPSQLDPMPTGTRPAAPAGGQPSA